MVVVDNKNELTALRKLRAKECFSVINRGKLWYDSLTDEQYSELKNWYFDWLNVTETKNIPCRPAWLNGELEQEEILW